MFRHLLRRHYTTMLWEWGLCRRYQIKLDSIDELECNTDVLALVARIDAETQTKALLSTDCLQGFLFNLLKQKWRRYGRYSYLYRLVAQIAFFGFLLA